MGFATWEQRWKVEALELAARAGFPMFSRYHKGWRVRLALGTAEIGAHIDVKRGDGSTARIEITRVVGDYPRSAPTFTLAEFKSVPTPLPHFARCDERWLVRVPIEMAMPGELIEVPMRDGSSSWVRVTRVLSTRPDAEVPSALVEFERVELDKPS